MNSIFQVILFQVLFLAIYDFFLSKETFFNKNRWYLISTSILSFILPFIKISAFQKTIPEEFIIYLPEIVLSPEKVIQKSSWYPSINYLEVLFWGGVVLSSVLFFVKLIKIINLIYKYKVVKKENFRLVIIPNKTKAFSFFNYIFLGKEIPKNQQAKIIEHELVHSKQKHSLDLLFFEFLKIAMWFNPMIFIYQKRITLVHEYISDEVAIKSVSKEIYINSLLSNFFQVENIAFINQFYKQSIIKKRIIMMTKQQSKKMNQLKYLVLIPVLMSMLFYSSCSESDLKEGVIAKKELKTMYSKIGENEMKTYKGTTESFLDVYMGTEIPKWKEISYGDLSVEQKTEYDKYKQRLSDINNSFSNAINLKLYKDPKGRPILGNILSFKKVKSINNGKNIETEEVSFLRIDKAPTFPGCEFGDKMCFSKMIQKHFVKNFDAKLPNQLGLKPERKRVFIGFKIDKNGNVVDVKARAPHIKIKEEVIRVMSSLPKMIPGEQDGKKVAVKYSIPFTIVVE